MLLFLLFIAHCFFLCEFFFESLLFSQFLLTLFFFMNDASFRASFKTPLVQIALGGAAVIMYVGYLVMSDMAREAV